MSDNSGIEWTEATWNPLAGCSAVSPGCTHCYAATMARRLAAMGQKKYIGVAERRGNVDVFTGKINLDPLGVQLPLKWKKPRRVFVNSMSDLFHESVPDEFIGSVVDTMAIAVRHTFQVLTKRPERMAELLPRLADRHTARNGDGWPLSNVWWGTSVEDRPRKDRIDELRDVPAAIRFLSLEPLLEDLGELDLRGIHWVIVGGESGPGARPFNWMWADSIIKQCKAADVPVFMKQYGSNPIGGMGERIPFKDKKGGDMSEWPESLRVREFPTEKAKAPA